MTSITTSLIHERERCEAVFVQATRGDDRVTSGQKTELDPPLLSADLEVSVGRGPGGNDHGVLLQERIGCMPITTDTGELLGIITRRDLLRAIVAFTAMDLRI